MLARLKLSWRKAKALSVLQNAYDLALKEPLANLDETDLRLVTGIAFDTGGNEFDAAAAFMTMRIKAAYQSNLEIGYRIDSCEDYMGKLAVGLARTRSLMQFYRLHMNTVSEIGALQLEVARRDAFNSLPADPPATS